MVAFCNNEKYYLHSSIVSEQKFSVCKVKKIRKTSVEATDRGIQLLCKGFDYHVKSLGSLEQKLRKMRKKKELLRWVIASMRTYHSIFERMYDSMLEDRHAATPYLFEFDHNPMFRCFYQQFLANPDSYLQLSRLVIDEASLDDPIHQLISRYDRREANLYKSRDFYLSAIREIHIEGQREPILSYDFIKSIRDGLIRHQHQKEEANRDLAISDELNMDELLKLMQGHSLN